MAADDGKHSPFVLRREQRQRDDARRDGEGAPHDATGDSEIIDFVLVTAGVS